MDIFSLSGREISLLLYLSQLGASSREISLTTSQIAQVLSISQQSASRLLHQCSILSPPLLSYHSSPSGTRVRLSEHSLTLLSQLLFEVERALYPDRTYLTITGSVFSGLGEGKYYVSQQEYQSSFIRVLGYSPFPGTLNIRVSPELTDRVDMLRGSWPLIVPGFSTETRQFGEVLCYPVTILSAPSTRVAIIMPRRTHHGHSVLEIISDINLRETLSLSDGDELTLQYFFNHDRK